MYLDSFVYYICSRTDSIERIGHITLGINQHNENWRGDRIASISVVHVSIMRPNAQPMYSPSLARENESKDSRTCKLKRPLPVNLAPLRQLVSKETSKQQKRSTATQEIQLPYARRLVLLRVNHLRDRILLASLLDKRDEESRLVADDALLEQPDKLGDGNAFFGDRSFNFFECGQGHGGR